MNDVVDLIVCECLDENHQIIIRYNIDSNWEEVFISYHLKPVGFWKRIGIAIGYIFGKKSKYGEFGELIIPATDDSIEKVEKVLDKLRRVQKRNIINQAKNI